jgi:hypothetical protein
MGYDSSLQSYHRNKLAQWIFTQRLWQQVHLKWW